MQHSFPTMLAIVLLDHSKRLVKQCAVSLASGCRTAWWAGGAGRGVMLVPQAMLRSLLRHRQAHRHNNLLPNCSKEVCLGTLLPSVKTVPSRCTHFLQGSMGNPLMKAALTSCSMSMLGDCLAQLLSRRPDKQVTLWGKLDIQLP